MADSDSSSSTQHSHSDVTTVTSVAEALDRVRRCAECAQDPALNRILEFALSEVWRRILAQPRSYIMCRDEFAIFNYFQARFEGQQIAIDARKRFWDNLDLRNGS